MLRILIVDDERVILNGIRMMIEEELELSFPADIVTASGAFQALELFEQFRPDLILTDIRMPGMDGFEMISRMREKNPSVNIAILAACDAPAEVRVAAKRVMLCACSEGAAAEYLYRFVREAENGSM